MASKNLSGLHDQVDRNWQTLDPEKEDISTYAPLSGEHEDLLDFYFGEPVATHKPGNYPLHIRSKW